MAVVAAPVRNWGHSMHEQQLLKDITHILMGACAWLLAVAAGVLLLEQLGFFGPHETPPLLAIGALLWTVAYGYCVRRSYLLGVRQTVEGLLIVRPFRSYRVGPEDRLHIGIATAGSLRVSLPIIEIDEQRRLIWDKRLRSLLPTICSRDAARLRELTETGPRRSDLGPS
jgi:hypothetical protein